MATIYILYSEDLNQFYIGSCNNLEQRLNQHFNKIFDVAHTKRANDWSLFYSRESLEYETARKIEVHIKRMKSQKYIQNLKRYPEIVDKLIKKYSAGSSR
ncbi:GIY-YIG nuclease family protein [Fluviicola sp.]|uniref:GIY-YIG nuclease family protein n=1 Tax=Fluviicola sp. TaxID=1917219 RepID=UPI003D28E68C